MKLALVLLLPISLSLACSDEDTTIRCGGDWEVTRACMNELGTSLDCYCFHTLQYYAIANNIYAEFEKCCERKGTSPRSC